MRICKYLGEQVGTELCSTCGGSVKLKVFDCNHPEHETTKLGECQSCRDFCSPDSGNAVTRWKVGVTTAPRTEPTLERTLVSLIAAGWDDPQLFAEPETEIPAEFEYLSVSHRPSLMGAFPNWLLALMELTLSDPLADAYFLCQDDVLFSLGLRNYLEQRLWPSSNVGVVSIYCPSHYERVNQYGFHVENRGWDSWGALAYIFPNPAARSLLGHPSVLNHRLSGSDDGARHVDSVVGRWCRELGNEYYVHSPSLAQHIGDTSTIWNASNSGKRKENSFIPDLSSGFK